MIWKECLPGRRFIGLDPFLFYHPERESYSGTFRPHSRDPKLPMALHINRESRRLALQHYTIMSNSGLVPAVLVHLYNGLSVLTQKSTSCMWTCLQSGPEYNDLKEHSSILPRTGNVPRRSTVWRFDASIGCGMKSLARNGLVVVEDF